MDKELVQTLKKGSYIVQDLKPSLVNSLKSAQSIFTEQSFMNVFKGQKTISSENLAPVLDKLKEHLVSKNLANEVAAIICKNIEKDLIGKPVGLFQGRK